MNESNPTPAVGEQGLRLEAERTRDELQETLTELEHRLAPRELAQSARRSIRRNPGIAIGIGLAAATVIVGLVVLAVRRG